MTHTLRASTSTRRDPPAHVVTEAGHLHDDPTLLCATADAVVGVPCA